MTAIAWVFISVKYVFAFLKEFRNQQWPWHFLGSTVHLGPDPDSLRARLRSCPRLHLAKGANRLQRWQHPASVGIFPYEKEKVPFKGKRLVFFIYD